MKNLTVRLSSVFLGVMICVTQYAVGQTCWSALGTGVGSTPYALTEYNGNLIAGGFFSTAGGAAAKNIAQWNGSSWSTLGSGLNTNPGFFGTSVTSFATYNGNLYVGGSFDTAGGVAAGSIALWNGSAWSSPGTGLAGRTLNYSDGGSSGPPVVYAMATYNNNLYAAGTFTSAGGVRAADIASWNGTSWAALGTGIDTDGIVQCLTVYNGKLIAAGDFNTAGGLQVANIAAWDGTSWSALGNGLGSLTVGYQYEMVQALAVYQGDLYASLSGTDNSGSPYFFVAKWDGTAWSGIAGGPGIGTNCYGEVLSMLAYGGKLIVGGRYNIIGNDTTNTGLAQWNGSSWSALANSDSSQDYIALTTYNGNLVAGGFLDRIDGVNVQNVAEYTCGANGINELHQSIAVHLYPNPTNGIFNISVDNLRDKATVSIYNLLGQRVLTSSLSADKTEINLAGEALGTYLYRVTGANGVQIAIGSFEIQ